VVASDPDSVVLEAARGAIGAVNVEFVQAPTGVPDLPAGSFDAVIYTLSLHHIPVTEMTGSLRKAASLLRKNGVIVVIEPGEGGSFTEAKERFGAGSGDERPAKEAAIRAMHALDGWTAEETILFRTLFQFEDDEDFLVSMMPDYRQKPESLIREIRNFLVLHKTNDGIILDADRRMNILKEAMI
jgi:SAM-dependent methyltransferase